MGSGKNNIRGRIIERRISCYIIKSDRDLSTPCPVAVNKTKRSAEPLRAQRAAYLFHYPTGNGCPLHNNNNRTVEKKQTRTSRRRQEDDTPTYKRYTA